MNIGISLIRLRELMKTSKKHKWNNYFALPDIGAYPNLKPLPLSTWALSLAKKLDKERRMTEKRFAFWKVKKLATEFNMTPHKVGRILRSIGAKPWGTSSSNKSYYWEDEFE